jgi:large subunit ribosomal protein L22
MAETAIDKPHKRRLKKRFRAEKLRAARAEHPRSLGMHVRISAQKARLVCDEIRGKGVEEALAVLEFMPKKAAKLVAKVLRSGIANAENNKSLDVDSLIVKRIEVGPGPTQKRFLPRAQGRATPLLKRSSHVTIVLDEKATD